MWLAAFAAVTGALLLLSASCGGSSDDPPTQSATAVATLTPPPKIASPINGVLIDQAEFDRLQQRPPLAVMIENFIDARPQSGLNKADLVYEAVAEGGITRFMAVFWSNDAERVQYIRSARLYYVQWASELGAVYVHWGQVEDPGVVDVWPVLSRLSMRDLNGQFLGEQVGFRDPDRAAPHNVYTSTGVLWDTAQAKGFGGPPTLTSWKFKDDSATRTPDPAKPSAPAIDISFGSPGSDYAVHWDYDAASNGYLRSEGGYPHVDATSGQQLTARNVAVQFAPLRPSGVKAYNVIDSIGSGPAVVFQDGVAIKGTWSKDSESGRTRFYDTSGAEIAFNQGRTWIEVVPADSSVDYLPPATTPPSP